MLHDRVKLKHDGQSKAAHGRNGIAAYTNRLQDSNAKHKTEYQVRIVLDKLAHRTPPRPAKAEIFSPLHYAVNDTKHEVCDDHHDDKYQHPAKFEYNTLDLTDK